MKSIEVKASTVEEAIEKGLAELGKRNDEVEIDIIDVGGFLKKAKVQLTVRPSEGERAVSFIKELTDKMGIKVEAELNEDDDKAEIKIFGEDSAKIIGHRGDCLDAVQYLTSVIVNKEGETFKKIIIDCGNYRKKRVETLENLANRLAEKAVTKGRKISLEPMNPFERRIIHTTLQSNPDVITESEGKEPNRFVVVKPKYSRPQRRDDFKKRGNDDRRRPDDRRGGAPRRSGGGQGKPKGFMGFGEYLGNSKTGAESPYIKKSGFDNMKD